MGVNRSEISKLFLKPFKRPKLKSIFITTVKKYAFYIVDLQQYQFMDGKFSNGIYLPNYSEASVEFYGKPDGPIKLFDTGSFYRGITAIVGDKSTFVTSTDEKTYMLIAQYDTSFRNLFGLSDEHLEEFGKKIIFKSFTEGYKREILK